MKRSLLSTIGLFIVLGSFAQNTCLTAQPVVGGTLYSVAVIDGTQIPIPICAPGGTGAVGGEWFSYTPTANYTVTLTTDLPQNAGVDNRFHVYTGACGGLQCLAGDDDSGSGNLAVATFNVQGGVTYIIAFDDRYDATGFDFLLEETPIVPQLISFTSQPISVVGLPMCVVDMNNDQLDDIVSTSASNIQVHYQQQGGGFSAVNIPTPTANFPASWSIAAGDLDANGQIDFVYGNGSGVTLMKANANGTAFTEISGPEYVFSQRTNMVDINNDGHLDAFVCHDVDPNVYYINDGLGNFTFNQGGLGDTPQGGNYGSIWIDYDNDHDVDLFIAKCGADPVNQLHRNDGNGVYTSVAPLFGLDQDIQTWSCAWGDYDNEGDLDVLVGASSFGNGGHALMRNDGTTFTDVTAGSGWDSFSGTGVEHTTHDFDNDGWVDVLGSNSTVLRNNGDMTFTAIVAGGPSGAIGDLNDDGYLDIERDGIIYMNDGGTNNWLRVHTVGTVSNKNGIGARVTITSALGTQIRDVKSGDGFKYMSSLMTHFGLGSDAVVDELTIHWPSGVVNTWTSIPTNAVFTAVEDPLTNVSEEPVNVQLTLQPVPTTDVLTIRTNANWMNAPVEVHDVSGKLVLRATMRSDRLDVSGLAPGLYGLAITLNGRVQQRLFAKE